VVVCVCEIDAVDHETHAKGAMAIEKVIFISNVDSFNVHPDSLEQTKQPRKTWRYPELGWLLFLILYPFRFLFRFFCFSLHTLLAALLPFLLFALFLFLFFVQVILTRQLFLELASFKHPHNVLNLIRFVSAVCIFKIFLLRHVFSTGTQYEMNIFDSHID
jgi:hypothetical protein